MPKKKPSLSNKVTLEDLLKLKRHEKPTPEFWQQFDRDLHKKTLQTFVQQGPSWRSAWQAYFKSGIKWVPAPIAALLVLTMISFGAHTSTQMASQQPEAVGTPSFQAVLASKDTYTQVLAQNASHINPGENTYYVVSPAVPIGANALSGYMSSVY